MTCQFQKKEKDLSINFFDKLREECNNQWTWINNYEKLALLSYIVNKNNFNSITYNDEPKYINYSQLYSALFCDYIKILNGEIVVESTLMNLQKFIQNYTNKNDFVRSIKKPISSIFARIINQADSSLMTNKNLLRSFLEAQKFVSVMDYYLSLYHLNPILYEKIVYDKHLSALENGYYNWEDDFPHYIETGFNLCLLYSNINPNKSNFILRKTISECFLRHGWRKDIIVSYLLVESLEILWRNNYPSSDTLIEYTENVFNLTLRVSEITDGKETWQGPYNVIDMLATFDIDLAENYKDKLIDRVGFRNYSNIVITSILIGKVKLGYPISLIDEGMNEFREDYDYRTRISREYFEQKIEVYYNILISNLYSKTDKKEVFDKIYNILVEITEEDYKLFLNDSRDEKILLIINEYCIKYNKKMLIPIKNSSLTIQISKMTEVEFVNKLKQISTKSGLRGIYVRLKNRKNFIELKNLDSWKALINKTIEINNDKEEKLSYLTDILLENNYPYMTNWSRQSKFLHLGIAAALDNVDSRQEIFKFLFDYSGYAGFVNVMKAFSAINDKNICDNLFKRYLKFCDLLVN